jgi:hypothetical protein
MRIYTYFLLLINTKYVSWQKALLLPILLTIISGCMLQALAQHSNTNVNLSPAGENVINKPQCAAGAAMKAQAATSDNAGGIVSHRWYSNHAPQIHPDQLLTDEGTRQYYLNTYGFEVFELFPDYPRWHVQNPSLQDVQEYKLRVSEWIDKNQAFTDFMEKRKKELEIK